MVLVNFSKVQFFKESVAILTKTVFLLIIFWNRKRWNRGIVNGTQHFWEQVEPEENSIYSIYSTPVSGIAGRAGIAVIVVIDLDELRAFILE